MLYQALKSVFILGGGSGVSGAGFVPLGNILSISFKAHSIVVLAESDALT